MHEPHGTSTRMRLVAPEGSVEARPAREAREGGCAGRGARSGAGHGAAGELRPPATRGPRCASSPRAKTRAR